jgi:seryl-tRNA synthetase
MLDIKLIRQNPDLIRQALKARGDDVSVEEVLSLDRRYHEVLSQFESLRAYQKDKGREYQRTEDASLREEMIHLSQEVDELQHKTREEEERLRKALLYLPNLPHPSVPPENRVVRTWGEKRHFEFTPQPHWELGRKLDIIDLDRGVKLSGSGFYILKKWGALLERTLVNFMLDMHTKRHGYTEIYPPCMVTRDCMVCSGNLPKFSQNLYFDAEDDLWLVPTAEVPLTRLHCNETLGIKDLPLYYVAFTPCFRREKMAWGRDTRGIKRVHQFNKVELYKIVEPLTSEKELAQLVQDAEDVCQELEIPYRVVELCAPELGFSSQKTYDIEMWAPGSDEWLEVSSCSNCGDFQARRSNIRYHPQGGGKAQLVHTLNGSGLALPRVFIAILENYQTEEGNIETPQAIKPYMG